MTVSVNLEFGGDLNTPEHRAVIMDIARAIEDVLKASPNLAWKGSLVPHESITTYQHVDFNTKEAHPYSGCAHKVQMGTAFHYNK